MTHRERALTALNHETTDRVPMDLGATLCSGIHVEAYKSLMKYLDLDFTEKDLVMHDKMQQLILPEERLLQHLGVDFRGIFPGAQKKNPDRFLDDGTWIDTWGVYRKKPKGALYYDMFKSPLSDDDVTIDYILNDYQWPDPTDEGRFEGLREKAEYLRNEVDCAIVLNYQAVFIHDSQYLRGFEGWYTDLIENPERLCAIFDRTLEFYFELGETLFKEVGEFADVVICSDDISGQSGPLFNPDIYREYIKPRQKKLFDFVKEKTNAKLLYHTCGTVLPFIDDLKEIGIDIMNPVQTFATDMDTKVLKKLCGKDIAFWGGIDTQRILPFGTVEEVEREVDRVIDDLAVDGGFVLNAVHNIQAGVKPENIVAMYERGKNHKLK